MKLLTAKPLIQEIYSDLREIISEKGLLPVLKIIQIGKDPAASFYINNLVKQGGKVGVTVELVTLELNIDNRDLLEMVTVMNQDTAINGILIQKPLPTHIDEEALNMQIDPAKDVDGFHPVNMGNL
ncbi:MAG: bifunctional 5,10-methylenetetrahydrofolate dehydrogenase/5,10-methenyltetrahydrofolate cyclohydrolase, partial [Candidatus Cloacimonetes bacterium]|nr:bifunctional 5,10-methylenetetrahydrofolate dehydrogenase/5,10-methenyltetrahydrofolate cyclohydrolase [Candidatus Cloacimonadota bacterium]